MNCFGFYEYMEKRADNRDFYRSCLRNPLPGVSEKQALKHLELLDRFPPDQPLERIASHLVEIYGMLNHRWETVGRRRRIIRGDLSHLVTVDFAEELLQDEGKKTEKVIEQDVIVWLEEGSLFVRGDKIQLVSENPDNLAKTAPYLDITLNRKGHSYSFRIKKEALSKEKPIEVHITYRLTFDGVEIENEKTYWKIAEETSSSGTRRLTMHKHKS
ncbi:hypothetical protein J4421_06580 [Candidatus Woesearchaeota archaeon]|nr:hypothetical protein [Candidatus Woesearchaeota archaeon]